MRGVDCLVGARSRALSRSRSHLEVGGFIMNAGRRVWRRAMLAAAVAAMGSRARAADVTSTWFGGTNLWSSSNWINNPPVSQYPNDGNGGFTYDAVLNSGKASLTEFITIERLTLAGAQIDAN